MKWSIVFLAVALNASVFAQTNQTVVPIGFENQPGNVNDDVFFGGEMQQLFRASALPNSWSGPVQITGVAFRVEAGAAASFNAVVPRIQVSMSTSLRVPEQMSSAYDLNRGSDEISAFDHTNVALSGATGPGINPFDIRLSFDRPFTYDRTTGNLLMYIKVTGSAPGTRTIDSNLFTDSNGPVSLSSSPVAGTGNSGPFGPGSVVPYALINEFSWVAVPEPSISAMFILGSASLILFIRRRSF